MQRLATHSLSGLPPLVRLPNYDRATLTSGILHLGVGAFHRAHQALYTDDLLNSEGGHWRIIAASMRSDAVAHQLQPQDCLYMLVEKGSETRLRVIGAIEEVIVAPKAPQRLLTLIASPAIKVITLTITEKGYCHNPATGELQLSHPLVAEELQHSLAPPLTALGFLVAGLALRRRSHSGGLTLLSCDNLPQNGKILRAVVLALAARHDPQLALWIEDHITFPSSMVDRIVPATTEEDRALVRNLAGINDEGVVCCEPFCQWVIENNFAVEFPNWAAVGATLVDDVRPYEAMKLRLLNGSHSLIAYIGVVAGLKYVHEVVSNSHLLKMVRVFMDAQTTTLAVPKNFDIASYQEQLLRRFANVALNHQALQIAQDGSQKLPQRWLQPLRQMAWQKQDYRIVALALASWIKFLKGQSDTGVGFEIKDPLHLELRQLVGKNSKNCANLVNAILNYTPVFGDLATEIAQLSEKVQQYLVLLEEKGNIRGVSELMGRW